MELILSGHGLIEGPRVDSGGNLYFSDVPRGGVYCRTPAGAVRVVVPKRRGVGGIALHADGGLVLSGRNVCHVHDGETRVLFEDASIGGFNDLFADPLGRVYVGSLRSDPFQNDASRTPGELYCLAPGEPPRKLYGDVGVTNGIGLSPDGQRLYHCDSARQHILVSDRDEHGSVARTRVFARLERGVPDGLAVDVEGCVWVAVYGDGCVARFRPDGSLAGTLAVPARSVASLCFGGADLRDLYIVTADHRDEPEREGCIFRARSDTPGLPANLARV